MIADFDPGMLPGMFIVFATIVLVVLCLVTAALSMVMKQRRNASRFLRLAGICLALGIGLTICATLVSSKKP